jgi:hypothetical protein
MSITKSIQEAFSMKVERNWDTLYFAIDLHGTIIEPGRLKDLAPFPKAMETLKFLSQQKDIVLILFTSTTMEALQPFWIWCKDNDIYFKYFNENPECLNTHEGDYTRKFYYNVLLDDRAGFEPLTDWDIVKSEVEMRTYGNN